MVAIFTTPATPPKRAAKLAQTWWQANPPYPTKGAMLAALKRVTMPASGTWAYARIPKNGTHTVLDALFFMECGTNVTTQVRDPLNTSEDKAPHILLDAGIFRDPLRAGFGPEVLEHATRFTIVRDPVKRALSGFRYLEQSHEAATPHLAATRLQLSALTQFDWAQDTGTAKGFGKYLDLMEFAAETPGYALDAHFAAQTLSVDPAHFQANLTGRLEELPAFLSKLAEVLDRPVPPVTTNANATKSGGFTASPDDRARAAAIFQTDMDWYESL